MFPYRDENETVRAPVVTVAIIIINVLVWIFIQGAGSQMAVAASTCNYGLIPGELLLRVKPGDGFPMGEGMACLMDPGRAPEHILYSMFLHGSWLHIGFNMWFLWIFGNNVEDSMGRGRFIIFYLLCGMAAAAAQVAADPSSMIPMVGASGAIGGVMGAYVLLYPRVRVFTLVWLGFFLTTVALPAWVFLGVWFGMQLLSTMTRNTGGVAVWAHVGGFLAGVLMIKVFARPEYIAEHGAKTWEPQRLGWRR